METLYETNFTDLKLIRRGKVRDVYDLGEYYLIVSTDRLSAFDVIMGEPIPYKGVILNQLSKFWLEYTSGITKNHFISDNVNDFPEICRKYSDLLKGRSMMVKKVRILPLECIVRGYISGSGWKDYLSSGMICGIKLPSGLTENQKLDRPLFTPSTKAEIGEHDQNIEISKSKEIVGKQIFERLSEICIEIYNKCSDYSLQRGIIIADTKMEFGLDENDELILADEILTPDSSRFWPANDYIPGRSQDSFDKQYVRDYLTQIGFNKQPPPPVIPEDVVRKTQGKYVQAYEILTGNKFRYDT